MPTYKAIRKSKKLLWGIVPLFFKPPAHVPRGFAPVTSPKPCGFLLRQGAPLNSRRVRAKMLWRSILAFLALPGVFAGLVPYILVGVDPWRKNGLMSGLIVLVGAIFGLLWCIRDFYASGKGTLAPWEPPKQLVVVGLYRFTRNPMYLNVLTMVAGWAIVAGSPLLAVYVLCLAVAFHLRVLFQEEPWLAKQFGPEREDYSTHVPRWVPRLSPWMK
ncbi:MAG: isoprenylcysteine carboxylmethyltransferase family protein [Sulfuricaulis sp.]|nr:isoprenylcysteine carboxylmethyltransferase family protein [Sulfuricaulis sp.]